MSIYVDVKSLHEILSAAEAPIQAVKDASISEPIYRAHLLRKTFLGAVISDLINELRKSSEARSLFQRWIGKTRPYEAAIAELVRLAADVKVAKLSEEEIPILRTLSSKSKAATKATGRYSASAKGSAEVSITAGMKAEAGMALFDEEVADNEVYFEYADAVLRSFPFSELLGEIRQFLNDAGITRLFVFFDDFSELNWVDQKLFVDVILSPLNNASGQAIKLKIAGYPGRVYYGKIDPGKTDTVGLDFYQLYKATDIQTMEASAINYLERLVTVRFQKFGENIAEYFDPATPMAEHFRLLFEATMNVPRLIGYILHFCCLDRVSKHQVITSAAIRLAAQKYYDGIVSQYFGRLNRFATEPFERKLDRHNQHQLLRALVAEARSVRRGISTGQVGGTYFHGLTNPPVSHFAINPDMESLLAGLELNFLVTKYHDMRDKDAKDVSVYSFFLGLCESERFPWGYPRGRRDDRSYFVQRCFNYNRAIQDFLRSHQTIRCDACGACFGMEMYKWRCPECSTGTCRVVPLREEVRDEIETLEKDTMLPPIELDILATLESEGVAMRAGEIGALVDATYQLVGRRGVKLHEKGLVARTSVEGVTRMSISEKAKRQYFGGSDEPAPDSD